MRPPLLRCRLALFALSALAVGGCGSPVSVTPTRSPSPTPGPSRSPGPSPGVSGALTVFAAASLTEALQATNQELRRTNPGLEVTTSFAGSQTLVTQVLAGAPADLVATADRESLQRLVDAGLLEPPVVIARNRLAIVVAPGNPYGIQLLEDLARPELAVVLADPAVPAGRAAASVLRRQGVKVKPRSLELDVKAVLRRVVAGEADAAIVYVTDVRSAGSRVTGVEIPAAANLEVPYPAAVVRATPHRFAARAYLAELMHGAGRRALLEQGFVAP